MLVSQYQKLQLYAQNVLQNAISSVHEHEPCNREAKAYNRSLHAQLSRTSQAAIKQNDPALHAAAHASKFGWTAVEPTSQTERIILIRESSSIRAAAVRAY